MLSPSYDTLNTLFATDEDIAPVRERGLLTKMNFDWSFNQDELLININMLDREINKNNIFRFWNKIRFYKKRQTNKNRF